MKKLILFLLLSCLCCCSLTACGENQPPKIDPNTLANQQWTGNDLTEIFHLETDQIEIYLFGSPDPIIITDPQDIQTLQDSVRFVDWQPTAADGSDAAAGIITIFVKFNDEVTIATYEDVAQGFIGQGIPDENGNLSQHYTAYKSSSPLFRETVLQMIEKYR